MIKLYYINNLLFIVVKFTFPFHLVKKNMFKLFPNLIALTDDDDYYYYHYFDDGLILM